MASIPPETLERINKAYEEEERERKKFFTKVVLENQVNLCSLIHGYIDLLNDLLTSSDLYNDLKKWHGEDLKFSNIVGSYSQMYVNTLKKNEKNQIYLPFGFSDSTYKDQRTNEDMNKNG